MNYTNNQKNKVEGESRQKKSKRRGFEWKGNKKKKFKIRLKEFFGLLKELDNDDGII